MLNVNVTPLEDLEKKYGKAKKYERVPKTVKAINIGENFEISTPDLGLRKIRGGNFLVISDSGEYTVMSREKFLEEHSKKKDGLESGSEGKNPTVKIIEKDEYKICNNPVCEGDQAVDKIIELNERVKLLVKENNKIDVLNIKQATIIEGFKKDISDQKKNSKKKGNSKNGSKNKNKAGK